MKSYRVILFLALIFTGCASKEFEPVTEEDKLSEKEKKRFVEYVRNKLLRSNYPKLDLKEKAKLRQITPECKFYYNAPQRGGVSMLWYISTKKVISVKGKGKFFSSSFQWVIRLINQEAFILKPGSKKEKDPKKDQWHRKWKK